MRFLKFKLANCDMPIAVYVNPAYVTHIVASPEYTEVHLQGSQETPVDASLPPSEQPPLSYRPTVLAIEETAEELREQLIDLLA